MSAARKRPRDACEKESTARGQGRWLVAALALFVAAGMAVWLVAGASGGGRSVDRSAATPATSAPSTSPSAPVTQVPLPEKPPAQVPQTILADAPQLPRNLAPVALSQASTYSNGVSARVVSIGAFVAKARRPGEISGPALAITVEVTNAGSDSVSLDSLAVNAYYSAAGSPATRVGDGAGTPLRGQLAVGKSARATYAFTVPADQRHLVVVAVSYRDGAATALFSGDLS